MPQRKRIGRKPKAKPSVAASARAQGVGVVNVFAAAPPKRRRRAVKKQPEASKEQVDVSAPIRTWSSGLYQAPPGVGYTVDPLKNSSALEQALAKFIGGFSGSLSSVPELAPRSNTAKLDESVGQSVALVPPGLTIKAINAKVPGFKSKVDVIATNLGIPKSAAHKLQSVLAHPNLTTNDREYIVEAIKQATSS